MIKAVSERVLLAAKVLFLFKVKGKRRKVKGVD
jgi:hypothetical protein